MCGIAGIVSFQEKPVLPGELDAMCRAIAHRGPDDDGFYLSKEAGLGMRRLSIIDLSTGHQPISNEEGSVWVVFNGEIYNYRELRAELEKQGHFFSTTTDTEVIVHLYEQDGEDCVRKLRGMFAFAVWDDRRKSLFLARDRLGIKPLYYTETGGRLVFASELKSILQLPDVPRELNWGALGHAFTFLATPATESIIQGVQKLEPGHTLVASAGTSPRIRCYWEAQFEPDRTHSAAYFTQRLAELIEESVALHMVSDVPVGAFLSGGMDSTCVVAMMSRISRARVMTFSIGFPDSEYNELPFARLAAQKFGTEHYELVLEPDVLGIVEDLAWYLDEPFGDSSAIPTYMVSRLASEHVKVVLSGDGGDELFAGYDKYAVESRERRYRFLPAALRRCLRAVSARMPEGATGREFLRHISLAGTERYLDSVSLFSAEAKNRLFEEEALHMLRASDPYAWPAALLEDSPGNWLSALQRFDLKHYLPLDILTKVDRMSMACSLEVRPPLLDHKLVEFAATIPPELQMSKGRTKHIFREAMKGLLPEEILSRPKRGFAIPLARWFRGHLDSYVRDLLLSERARQRGIFRSSYIEKLLELNRRGRNLDMQLWTLICFELWCRTFLDHVVDRHEDSVWQTNPRLVSPAEARPGGMCAA